MKGLNTRAVHAGEAKNTTSSVVTPIHQTSTFRLESAADGAEKMASLAPEDFYTRYGNPTVACAESALASLEGAEGCILASSGMGAMHGLLATFLRPGDRLVASGALYSGTMELLQHHFPELGVEVVLVDAGDLDAVESALASGAKLFLVEAISNPRLDVADLPRLAELAHAAGALAAIDATFAGPAVFRPLEHGYDLVMHSTTKSLNGHSDATGGAVLGSRAHVHELWKKMHLLGACLAPFEAWLLRRGLRTLELRVARQCENALELARHLQAHPQVEHVYYPGLADHPAHDLATRLFADRFGGMITFDVAGGLEATRRVVEGAELITLAVSLGGVESLWQHPATMSHAPIGENARRAAGIGEGMVRFSVGIEDVDDLKADLDRALDRAGC